MTDQQKLVEEAAKVAFEQLFGGEMKWSSADSYEQDGWRELVTNLRDFWAKNAEIDLNACTCGDQSTPGVHRFGGQPCYVDDPEPADADIVRALRTIAHESGNQPPHLGLAMAGSFDVTFGQLHQICDAWADRLDAATQQRERDEAIGKAAADYLGFPFNHQLKYAEYGRFVTELVAREVVEAEK